MTSPLISIVMPLYNKASTVVDSIKSVQSQTIEDWELIVVDDGSTDDGQARVASLCDSRIRIVSQANSGVSVARNAGANVATCALIAFLDADDLWEPEFLESILALRRDFPGAGIYATSYKVVSQSGVHYQCRLNGMPVGFLRGLLPAYFRVAALSDPPVWSSAVAIDGEVLKTIGGFPPGVLAGEDLLTWARLAVSHPLAYDTRALAVHLVSEIRRPADPAFKVGAALEELWRAYPTVPGLKQYVALWWRMQATMALHFRDTRFSRQLALRSLRYDCINIRSIYLILMSWLPSSGIPIVDRVFRRALGRRN